MALLTIPADLLARYLANPLGTDAEVRKRCQIPEDRYYNVAVWPVAGRITVERSRAVKAHKISKSDSQPA